MQWITQRTEHDHSHRQFEVIILTAIPLCYLIITLFVWPNCQFSENQLTKHFFHFYQLLRIMKRRRKKLIKFHEWHNPHVPPETCTLIFFKCEHLQLLKIQHQSLITMAHVYSILPILWMNHSPHSIRFIFLIMIVPTSDDRWVG